MPLTVEDLHVAYGATNILNGVMFEVGAGQSVAVMGPSGSGKSTLMAAIAGELEPNSGRISRSGIGSIEWIFQSAPILARRSALDNVALGPLARGSSRSRSIALATRAMKSLGIFNLARSPAFRLSGGERQRVAVARALASGSELILADEPTAALDSQSKGLVIAALLAATSYGASLIVATHDDEVALACDRTYQLHAGQLKIRVSG